MLYKVKLYNNIIIYVKKAPIKENHQSIYILPHYSNTYPFDPAKRY